MSAKFFLLPLALLGLGVGILLTRVMDARADPSRGLYFEEAAGTEGVTVRRLRDRGEDMVCYVVTGRQVSGDYHLYTDNGRNVAISCWPVKR